MSRLQINEEHEIEEEEEEEFFLHRFPKAIFTPRTAGEIPPEGFDAVKILIDGRLKSDLCWKLAREYAKNYVNLGLSLFWEIDLGLFNQLELPIENESQFLSLSLSLEHFQNTLWKEFRKETIGLCLYQGSLSMGPHLIKNQITSFKDQDPLLACLSSAQIGAEYLNLLASRLPDTLPCFALIDLHTIKDPFLAAQILHKESYKYIRLGVNKWETLGADFIWDTHLLKMPSSNEIGVAVCLPSPHCKNPQEFYAFNNLLVELELVKIPYRVIPESMLIMEWNGLDSLVVYTPAITPEGRRKLSGFCAAEGTIVTVGPSLGLPKEISFTNFLRNTACQKLEKS